MSPSVTMPLSELLAWMLSESVSGRFGSHRTPANLKNPQIRFLPWALVGMTTIDTWQGELQENTCDARGVYLPLTT
jgi:hypothetical protein